jgi:hypothetical protein
VIVVIDEGGHIIEFTRMDTAQRPSSIDRRRRIAGTNALISHPPEMTIRIVEGAPQRLVRIMLRTPSGAARLVCWRRCHRR